MEWAEREGFKRGGCRRINSGSEERGGGGAAEPFNKWGVWGGGGGMIQ